MPRELIRAFVDDEISPISGDEISKMWIEVGGPAPSEEECAQAAEQLTHHRGHGSAQHVISRRNRRAMEGAQMLLKVIENWLEPFHTHRRRLSPEPVLSIAGYNKLAKLRDAIKEALPVLNPLKGAEEVFPAMSATRPVWESAAAIMYLMATKHLKKRNRTAGHTANSVAVKFAVRATQRIGFPGISAAALSQRLRGPLKNLVDK